MKYCIPYTVRNFIPTFIIFLGISKVKATLEAICENVFKLKVGQDSYVIKYYKKDS
jgi:hypothetical protein